MQGEGEPAPLERVPLLSFLSSLPKGTKEQSPRRLRRHPPLHKGGFRPPGVRSYEGNGGGKPPPYGRPKQSVSWRAVPPQFYNGLYLV